MVYQCTSDADFKEKLAAAGSKPVIIDFTASWCGPCRFIAPVFAELSEKYGESVVFLKVDVDELEATSAEYDISAMPTFLVLVNGEKVDSLRGANKEGLEELVVKYAQA